MTSVHTSVFMTIVIFGGKGANEEPVTVFSPPKLDKFFKLSKYLGIRYYSDNILS